MPTISIKPETIITILNFPVTNSFITSILVIVIFIFIALKYHQGLKTNHKNNFFYLLHFIFKSIYSLFESVFGNKTKFFFPLLFSFFIYILLQNWFGLLPGVGSILVRVKEDHGYLFIPLLRGSNADLNATFALGIISVVMIQVFGIKFLGFKQYLSKFINLTNPLNLMLGLLEIVSELSKIMSFSFRLFGNIFAGEVLITIIAFLIPVLAAFPFLLLELFVGFIQALVFSMLTAVFISGAVQEHH